VTIRYYAFAIHGSKVTEVFVAESNEKSCDCYNPDVGSTDASFKVLKRDLFPNREEAEEELAVRVLADNRVRITSSIRERVHQPFFDSLVRAPGVSTNIDDTQHLFPSMEKKK